MRPMRTEARKSAGEVEKANAYVSDPELKQKLDELERSLDELDSKLRYPKKLF